MLVIYTLSEHNVEIWNKSRGNAASVAAMFLTTEAVVANVPQDNAGGGMPDMGGMGGMGGMM